MRELFAEIISAAHSGATGVNGFAQPTVAQLQSGNYRKGRVQVHGLDIAIETPQGQRRQGKSDGEPWSVICQAHYGDISGTRGADGDPVDVFVGPVPESRRVWVVNQTGKDGSFDEHKVLLGFADEASARAAYMNSYERGWKGLGSMVGCTVDQLRWWLKFGDTTKPMTLAALPHDGENDDMNEQNFDTGLADILYGIRRTDPEGLMFDSLTVADILQDSDGEDVLDALVIPFNKLERKMGQLNKVMEDAGEAVKPVAVQITPPFKQRGTTNVAAVFELSDGQTVSIFFHNPDTTPNKITPGDEMVSWKWLLNKKDVTIAVAPEKGQDLNVREVARRVMRLAERNSARFAKTNAGRAERLASIEGLKAQVAAKEQTLAELDTQVAELTTRVEAKRAEPQPQPQPEPNDLDPTSPDGYAKVMADEKLQLAYQDQLDSFFQGRLIAVRNALRDRGWDGPKYQPLSKAGFTLSPVYKQVGAGANIVGIHYEIAGVPGFFMSDDLTRTPEELAEKIDMGIPQERPMVERSKAVKAELAKLGWNASPGSLEAMVTIDGSVYSIKSDQSGKDVIVWRDVGSQLAWEDDRELTAPEMAAKIDTEFRAAVAAARAQALADQQPKTVEQIARELTPDEFETRDDAEGFTAVAPDGLGLRIRRGPRGTVLGYVLDAKGQDSLGSRGTDPEQIRDLVETALRVIAEKRGGSQGGGAMPFPEWEEAFYTELEEQGEMSRSDAQGVAEAQGDMMNQQYQAGATPEVAAAAVLAASTIPDEAAGDDAGLTAAKAFLAAVIDGSADYMDAELADRLEAIHNDYADNEEVMAQFNAAADAYSAYMIEQAKKALA